MALGILCAVIPEERARVDVTLYYNILIMIDGNTKFPRVGRTSLLLFARQPIVLWQHMSRDHLTRDRCGAHVSVSRQRRRVKSKTLDGITNCLEPFRNSKEPRPRPFFPEVITYFLIGSQLLSVLACTYSLVASASPFAVDTLQGSTPKVPSSRKVSAVLNAVSTMPLEMTGVSYFSFSNRWNYAPHAFSRNGRQNSFVQTCIVINMLEGLNKFSVVILV